MMSGSLGTSDIIAAIAVIVAAFALAVSVSELMANRPRLRVGYAGGVGVGGMTGHWLLVSVINWGRQPTTISSLSIELPGLRGTTGGACHAQHMAVGHLDHTPFVLGVGVEAKFAFRLDDTVNNVLATDGADGALLDLMRKYGARVLVNSTWHRAPIRKSIQVEGFL